MLSVSGWAQRGSSAASEQLPLIGVRFVGEPDYTLTPPVFRGQSPADEEEGTANDPSSLASLQISEIRKQPFCRSWFSKVLLDASR